MTLTELLPKYQLLINNLDRLLSWVTSATAHLKGLPPIAKTTDELNSQLEEQQSILISSEAFLEDVASHKEPISKALYKTEAFITEYSEVLKPEQREALHLQSNDLKTGYENLIDRSEERLRKIQEALRQLERSESRGELLQGELDAQYRRVERLLQDQIDWATDMEKKVKDIPKSPTDLHDLKIHLVVVKGLQYDIIEQKGPVSESISRCDVFLKKNKPKLKKPQQTALPKKMNDLKTRYEKLGVKLNSLVKTTDDELSKANKAILREEFETVLEDVTSKLRWVDATEAKLVQETVTLETVEIITVRIEQHMVIYEEIKQYREVVFVTLHNATTFELANRERLEPEQSTQIIGATDRLRSGFDRVVSTAETRLTDLKTAVHALQQRPTEIPETSSLDTADRNELPLSEMDRPRRADEKEYTPEEPMSWEPVDEKSITVQMDDAIKVIQVEKEPVLKKPLKEIPAAFREDKPAEDVLFTERLDERPPQVAPFDEQPISYQVDEMLRAMPAEEELFISEKPVEEEPFDYEVGEQVKEEPLVEERVRPTKAKPTFFKPSKEEKKPAEVVPRDKKQKELTRVEKPKEPTKVAPSEKKPKEPSKGIPGDKKPVKIPEEKKTTVYSKVTSKIVKPIDSEREKPVEEKPDPGKVIKAGRKPSETKRVTVEPPKAMQKDKTPTKAEVKKVPQRERSPAEPKKKSKPESPKIPPKVPTKPVKKEQIKPKVVTEEPVKVGTVKDVPGVPTKPVEKEQIKPKDVTEEPVEVETVEDIPGVVDQNTGKVIPVTEAFTVGLIDRETVTKMLTDQLDSGGIVDPDTGKKLTPDEAQRLGVIEPEIAATLQGTHPMETVDETSPDRKKRLPEIVEDIVRPEKLQRVEATPLGTHPAYDELEGVRATEDDREKKMIEDELKEHSYSLEELLKWVSAVELSLGSEQPLKEEPRQLNKQVKSNKDIAADVDDHKKPVTDALSGADIFLATYGDKVDDVEAEKLRRDHADLTKRYEKVADETDERDSNLDDSKKTLDLFTKKVSSFETWLVPSERTLKKLQDVS
ncbi:uncharacterized protein LOC102809264 [Saccoglossus kowalevskii]